MIKGSPYVIQRYSTHVTITCSVQPSANANADIANLTMRWLRFDQVMMSNAGSTQLDLDLADFAEMERGEYVCDASNVRGRASPRSVQVYGKSSLRSSSPSFCLALDNLAGLAGFPTFLDCLCGNHRGGSRRWFQVA